MKTQKLNIKSLAQLNCLLPDGMRFYPHKLIEAQRVKEVGGSFLLLKTWSDEYKFQEMPSGEISLKDIPENFLLV